MPLPVENISSDLINFLKDRFEISETVDEKGVFTDDPAKTKVFSFDYVNQKGENKGCVVISLLDDNESANSLKIYFGQELADAEPNTRKEWYAFLQELRQFAKMHMLGFDVRNINKSKISRRDIEKDIKLVKEDLEPMYESSFGPIDGTVKTSIQKLEDSNVRLVIKHRDRIDPKARYGRSHKIDRIYVVNGKGEKFLLPFPSLMFARAMARHIEAGGTPYDNIGGSMCQLMDQLKAYSHSIKFFKKHFPTDDIKAQEGIQALRNEFHDVKKQLSRLTSSTGYNKFHSSVPVDTEIVDDGEDLTETIFNGIELDEETENALPYIHKAYEKFKKSPEQNEFEKWVLATKGQGEGNEILTDTEEDDQIARGKEAAQADLQQIKKEKESADRPVQDQTIIMAGSFESRENKKKVVESRSLIQRRKGKLAGKRDIQQIKKERADANNSQPEEWGSMYGMYKSRDQQSTVGHQTVNDSIIHQTKPINEFLGFGKPKGQSYDETFDDLKGLNYALRFLGFDLQPKKYQLNSYKFTNRYFTFLVAIVPAKFSKENTQYIIKWQLIRNGKIVANGTGIKGIAATIMNFDEFRDHAAKWDDFVANPTKYLTEADIPQTAAWAGPLTFPKVILPPNTNTSKEIARHKNTTGKLSPFSLISASEEETDSSGKVFTPAQSPSVKNFVNRSKSNKPSKLT